MHPAPNASAAAGHFLQEVACSALDSWFSPQQSMCVPLQDRDTARRQQGKWPKCHFFNSFFVNKLIR